MRLSEENEKEKDHEEKDSQEDLQEKKKGTRNNKKKKVERKKPTQKSQAMDFIESQATQEPETSQGDRSRSKARQAKIKRRQASTEDDSRSDNMMSQQQRGLTPIARRLRDRTRKH